MRVIVLGGDGQLGADVVRAFEANGDDVFPLTHTDIEIATIESVPSIFTELQPELLVNTAAMHHVEQCELHPDQAFAVNALGVRKLALAAREIGAVLMHISTDYVFDGAKGWPYSETDAPRPLSVYGNSKLAGEYFVRSTLARHFVLRTSALYGKQPCRAKGGLNFVQLMLKLAKERGAVRVVDDEFVTPTSTEELARQMVALSRSEAYGLYHGTADGECSWFEFAREIFALTHTEVTLTAAGPNEFPAKVSRPKYAVLENRGLKLLGLNTFGPWQDGLREYLGISPLKESNTDDSVRDHYTGAGRRTAY
ncbi:MAG TPA: dTDP-4-dehydrorhamnose reductase [Terriglobales bacterium]|nr:dTDP-4-dehydrorhamnose reductase [Terriglobales bacterium]